MKISKSIILSILGFCITVEGWNDFTQRYGPSGHIPTIPLYFKAPKQQSYHHKLQKKIEALEQSIQELQESKNQQNKKEQGHHNATAALHQLLNREAARLVAARNVKPNH